MNSSELETFIELKHFPVTTTKEYVDSLPDEVILGVLGQTRTYNEDLMKDIREDFLFIISSNVFTDAKSRIKARLILYYVKHGA
jgi:hypothetical protein